MEVLGSKFKEYGAIETEAANYIAARNSFVTRLDNEGVLDQTDIETRREQIMLAHSMFEDAVVSGLSQGGEGNDVRDQLALLNSVLTKHSELVSTNSAATEGGTAQLAAAIGKYNQERNPGTMQQINKYATALDTSHIIEGFLASQDDA